MVDFPWVNSFLITLNFGYCSVITSESRASRKFSGCPHGSYPTKNCRLKVPWLQTLHHLHLLSLFHVWRPPSFITTGCQRGACLFSSFPSETLSQVAHLINIASEGLRDLRKMSQPWGYASTLWWTRSFADGQLVLVVLHFQANGIRRHRLLRLAQEGQPSDASPPLPPQPHALGDVDSCEIPGR